MRIIEFQAENIKKLKVVQIKPKGDVIEITGANGSGKTSVLDSILYTLAGTDNLPSQPIRRGADKGGTMVDLGEYIVIRKFTAAGSTLIVQGKKGERYQKPQQLLDGIFGNFSFDPLAFTRMHPKTQAEELRKLVRLDIDPDALDKANKEDYDARTIHNREIKQLEAQAAGISIVAELPAAPVDLSALITQLQQAGTHNAERANIEALHLRRQDDIKNQRDTASQQTMKAAALEKEAKALREMAAKARDAADAAEEKLKGETIPPPIDTAELREEIENARATNAQIDKRTQKEILLDKLAYLNGLVEGINEAMKGREKQKADAIAKASMPIEGLGFENGEVMYMGLPLNQASGAEQLRVSLSIAMASNPKARVILMKDGSLLDDNSMEIVKQMAGDRDYQIWIETVDTSGKVGIVMEDGMVSAVNDEEEEQPEAVPVVPIPPTAPKARKAAKG